jgi:hypothetical protein
MQLCIFMHDMHNRAQSRSFARELLSTELSMSGRTKWQLIWNICTCANGGPEEEGLGAGKRKRIANDEARMTNTRMGHSAVAAGSRAPGDLAEFWADRAQFPRVSRAELAGGEQLDSRGLLLAQFASKLGHPGKVECPFHFSNRLKLPFADLANQGQALTSR